MADIPTWQTAPITLGRLTWRFNTSVSFWWQNNPADRVPGGYSQFSSIHYDRDAYATTPASGTDAYLNKIHDAYRHVYTTAEQQIYHGSSYSARLDIMMRREFAETPSNFTSIAGLRDMYQDLHNNALGESLGKYALDQTVWWKFWNWGKSYDNFVNVEKALTSGQAIVNTQTDDRTLIGNWDMAKWNVSNTVTSMRTTSFRGRDAWGTGDYVIGTSYDDFINLLDGDDAADGGFGCDIIYGGAGKDLLAGGYGNDYIFAGSDIDIVQEVGMKGAGNDYIDLGSENDYLSAGGEAIFSGKTSRVEGIDTFVGGTGFDTITYEQAKGIKVTLQAYASNNPVADQLNASAHLLYGRVVSNAGFDDTVGSDTFNQFEHVIGSNYADVFNLMQYNTAGVRVDDALKIGENSAVRQFSLDGGGGFDTLKFTSKATVDLTGNIYTVGSDTQVRNAWSGIEHFDMTGNTGGADILRLSTSNIALNGVSSTKLAQYTGIGGLMSFDKGLVISGGERDLDTLYCGKNAWKVLQSTLSWNNDQYTLYGCTSSAGVRNALLIDTDVKVLMA